MQVILYLQDNPEMVQKVFKGLEQIEAGDGRGTDSKSVLPSSLLENMDRIQQAYRKSREVRELNREDIRLAGELMREGMNRNFFADWFGKK